MQSNEVEIHLLPGQRQMINLPLKDVQMDICCYQGGYGSGKTKGGVDLGLLLAEKYQGVPGLVCGMTWPLIRDTTLQTYFEAFDERGYLEGRDYIWKAEKKALVFPKWGNSTILFRSLDNPNKLKSLNLGWVHVEEMSETTESAFQMLLSRLRHKKMSRYRLFGTTNPQANKGWIFKYFVENAGLVEEEIEGRSVRINYRRVLAPSTQNKFLSAANLLNMKAKYDPEYYRINVLGEDGDYSAGLVCKTWSDANKDEGIIYRPELKIYLFCDFNVDPMCWEVFHRYHVPGDPHSYYDFFDEVVIENTTTQEAAEEFFRRYEGHNTGVIIGGDASGSNRSTQASSALTTNYTIIRNTLSRLGMRNVHLDIKAANPPVESRTAAWNRAVCDANGVRHVKVNPIKCPWLVYNCENLKYVIGSTKIWEPTPKQIEQDRNLKFTKHPWDAASYGVDKYDPIKLTQDDRKKPMVKTHVFTAGR